MITNQLKLFIIYIISGFGFSIIFDFFRSLRLSVKTSNKVTNAEDVIYLLIVGTILITILARYNYGELRFFMIIALIIGINIYYTFFSRLIIKIVSKIFLSIKKMIQLLRRNLILKYRSLSNFYKKILKK